MYIGGARMLLLVHDWVNHTAKPTLNKKMQKITNFYLNSEN